MNIKKQAVTLTLFIALLIIRIPFADLALFLEQHLHTSIFLARIEKLVFLQGQSYYAYEKYSYILAAVVIFTNRINLKEINIDKSFLIVFMFSGLSYGLNSLEQLGWIIASISIFMFIIFLMGWYKSNDPEVSYLRILLVTAILFFFSLLFISKSINFSKIVSAKHWLLMGLSYVAVEEIIFRGLFWMYLKRLKIPELIVVILQALLFWFSHVYYAVERPFFFWLLTPLISITLGIIVWRSKSITPSTFFHMLFNIWWSLFAYRNL